STGVGKHLPHHSTSGASLEPWIHGVPAKEGWIHGRQREDTSSSSAAGDGGQEDASSGCCPRGQRVGARDRRHLRVLLRLGLRTRALPRPLQPVLLLSSVRPADGCGGSCGERPRHRDAVLRRTPGGRGGAGAASPVPPSLGPPCPRLPRARARHRRPLLLRRASPPLPRRRPRRPLLQDLLNRGHLRLRGGRHHQLPGPHPRPRGVGLGSRASSGSCLVRY
uniref:Uncharacterized protein n=2 Tax=Aegilops tauschii subsp. strangulata TaxID=200361 RepID=A0A453JLN7_AEGTS